jgi:hypothetical protein
MKSFFLCLILILSPFSYAAESQLNPATSWGDSLIRVQRGRGHPGDKISLISGDVINGLAGRGYNGSAFTTSDAISLEFQASESWTSTANGTMLLIKTTPVTTATAATSLTVSSAGLGLLSDAAPRTNLTPLSAGTIVWNSADGQLCVSSGTTATTWVQVSSPTVACSH